MVNFTDRRPTDYKLNSRIKLPRPLPPESEFSCELKRMQYMAEFEKFEKCGKINNKSPTILSKNGKKMIALTQLKI